MSFFYVEQVLRHKGKTASTLEFYIKWLGFPIEEATWLKWKYIRQNARVHEYMKNIPALCKLIPKGFNEAQARNLSLPVPVDPDIVIQETDD